MGNEWNALPDAVQIALSSKALNRAVGTIARQAELLADEMEDGNVVDRGGADALRLFAALMRVGEEDGLTPVGNA